MPASPSRTIPNSHSTKLTISAGRNGTLVRKAPLAELDCFAIKRLGHDSILCMAQAGRFLGWWDWSGIAQRRHEKSPAMIDGAGWWLAIEPWAHVQMPGGIFRQKHRVNNLPGESFVPRPACTTQYARSCVDPRLGDTGRVDLGCDFPARLLGRGAQVASMECS